MPFRRHYKFLDTSDDEPGPSLDECCKGKGKTAGLDIIQLKQWIAEVFKILNTIRLDAISCMESHQDPFEDVSKGEVSQDQVL